MDKYTEPERRQQRLERRKRPTHILSRHTLLGRREKNRRSTDLQFNYYVDLYSSKLFTPLLLIVILSLLDAIFTYNFISKGGKELNPIMDVLIQQGPHSFFPYKFALTAIGVFILCLHKNFSFVRVMISIILVVYVLLTFYHVSILYAF